MWVLLAVSPVRRDDDAVTLLRDADTAVYAATRIGKSGYASCAPRSGSAPGATVLPGIVTRARRACSWIFAVRSVMYR